MHLAAVGGVLLKPGLPRLTFQFWAVRSFSQAQKADGCVLSDVAGQGRLAISITAWESPAAMRAYARSGPHAKAAARIEALSTDYEFLHFPTAAVPTKREALSRWWVETDLGRRLSSGQHAITPGR